MAVPSYALTNLFYSTDTAGDVVNLIETRLTDAGWTFVEQVAFTQSATARYLRVWKNPAALNASGADFFIGIVKNQAAGLYLSVRAFEGWNATTKAMLRPVLTGTTNVAGVWSSVAYGNGVYVAVGASATGISTAAAYSSDGITWTSTIMPAQGNWSAVAFGNGVFVAVAGASYSASAFGALVPTTVAATSTDGITWTARTMPSSSPWTAVAYGGSLWVAVAYNTASYATSTDGITWTARTMTGGANPYSGIAYGGGTWVVVTNGAVANNIYTSTTGTGTWTSRSASTAGSFTAVAYGGGVFLGVGTGVYCQGSTDGGVTWTARPMALGTGTGIAFGNGNFYVTGAGGTSTSFGFTADLGGSMVARTTPGPASGVTVGPDKVVVVGPGTVFTSAWYTIDNGVSTVARSLGIASSYALGDYALPNVVNPLAMEVTATLSGNTSYDVVILASRSYLAFGLNVNGTANTTVGGYVGLYQPAYTDSQVTNPPLCAISLSNAYWNNALGGGVSRSMRVPLDATAWAAALGPESIIYGGFDATPAREPVTSSIRAARVAVLGGSSMTFNFTASGGFRGWLYDAIAVGLKTATSSKVADTVSIGSTTWTQFSTGPTSQQPMPNTPFAYFFNTSAGS